MTMSATGFFAKYHMEQFVQIMLMVVIVYITLTLAVRAMFGDHTRLIVVMATILITCLITLGYSLT
jgi:hypothetical protein